MAQTGKILHYMSLITCFVYPYSDTYNICRHIQYVDSEASNQPAHLKSDLRATLSADKSMYPYITD